MKETLQQMAKLAKQRIKMGYHYEEALCSMMSMNNNSEEEMYHIVKSMLEEDELVTNPIAKLMDKDYYESLDEQGKSRYILELSNVYLRLRSRYYESKTKIC